MLTVGLSGGIASGKSTISALFAKRGVPVIDTDVISRSLLEPGEIAYQRLCEHCGDSIVTNDGLIDRKKLRQLIFSNAEEKAWLETMLHPLIYQRSQKDIQDNSTADYVIVVIPLLFETNFQTQVERICVVNCPAELQIKRLIKRDKIDETLARKMLDQQLSNDQRVARAHDVIDNQGDGSNLEAQVETLHQSYLSLSHG
jgi:dephospho-CoA kinase